MDMSKVVTFTNITEKEFSHSYNGQAYFVAAGETRIFPFALADHLAKHLARKILLSQDKAVSVKDEATGGLGAPIWSEEAVVELKKEILGEVETRQADRVKSDDELLAEKVAELNQVSEVTADPSSYKSKKDVIAALESKGTPVDVRKTKEELLAQLEG